MKILIIEDDVFFRKFYTEKLLEQGYTVNAASNGEEGLTLARNMLPDLIILDLIMPKKDGFDVLEERALDDTLKNIPVLVFSTLNQDDDVKKALQLGATGYVNKGLLDFNLLMNKINSVQQKKTQ